MPTHKPSSSKNSLRWIIVTLALAGVGYMTLQGGEIGRQLSGYLVRPPLPAYEWLIIDQINVASGTVIPADTHVVFHLPATFTRINRETMLGQKGEKTRYWGYCFPENARPETVDSRTGFPGLIFLSEKERAVRAAEESRQMRSYSPIRRLPNQAEVKVLNQEVKPAIRHQLDVFQPRTMCYIMTDSPLSIGLDADGDRLNDELEREIGTNPATPDSDGDGIWDGAEHLNALNPLIRDSDLDGLIDGIEDANWNGRFDRGETDPRTLDTDRDGLCDGMCRVRLQRREIYMGEDQNLNGTVDEGETDPRRYDTKGDGVSDKVPYVRCLAEGKAKCP